MVLITYFGLPAIIFRLDTGKYETDTGRSITVTRKLKTTSDYFRAFTGKDEASMAIYKTIAGKIKTLTGKLKTTSGHFRVTTGKFTTTTGKSEIPLRIF